jgi:hypothetical protein
MFVNPRAMSAALTVLLSLVSLSANGEIFASSTR